MTQILKLPVTQAGPTRRSKQTKYGPRKGIKPPGRKNITKGL